MARVVSGRRRRLVASCSGRCPCGALCNLPAGHAEAAFERADMIVKYHECRRPSKNALASRERRQRIAAAEAVHGR